jgi:hypothetical protein
MYYEIHQPDEPAGGEGMPLLLIHGSFMTINSNYGALIPEFLTNTPLKAEYDRVAPNKAHWNEFLTKMISFFVSCKDQKEVDYYWEKLSESGQEQPCGWLKDKFGLSWQIVPEFISEKVDNGEPNRVQNMMQALSQMKKLIIADLEKAGSTTY